MSRITLVDIGYLNAGREPITPKAISEVQLRRTVFRILEQNVLCSIATVTSGKRAHINTAYFCYSADMALYFLSHPSSQHCRNLSTHSSMAMTVFSSHQRWGGADQGLQLFGSCHPVREALARPAEGLYSQRFRRYAAWKRRLEKGDPAATYQFYRFQVTKLKILDEKELGGGVFIQARVKRNDRRT